MLSVRIQDKQYPGKLWDTIWMREKKLFIKNIESRRAGRFLLLKIRPLQNLRILQPNVSWWDNCCWHHSVTTITWWWFQLMLISQIHFREAWINRKSHPERIHDYQSCLTVFNNALEKKDQSDGFTTNHIGYFKQIRKQCGRCSWLKKNNYPHKKCFKNCIGRLKMTRWIPNPA